MKRMMMAAALVGALALAPASANAAPQTELVYADGQTYGMVGAHLVADASPGLLNSPPLYLLGFPVPAGTTTPITLPSGYQPQCNPCLEEPIAYHDHLVTGAPGLGTLGTSGLNYAAPWRIVVMMYAPSYANSLSFVPVTSDDQLAAAEAAGEFLPINRGAPDPYQIWTQHVLICPIVGQHSSTS